MRQTPFGVWNTTQEILAYAGASTAMMQTPFGVWNAESMVKPISGACTAMRQTPFGVWNRRSLAFLPAWLFHCNEADAFWRLERDQLQRPLRVAFLLQ